MKKISIIAAALFTAVLAFAQSPGEDTFIHPELVGSRGRGEVKIPNIEGYITLKGDFHTHSVFSDGSVWPNMRVSEAWWHGLDILAITEHVEYRPKKKYFNDSVDHNTAYEIALEANKKKDLIIVPGAEVTRKKPFGHMNALFVTDANAADVKDPMQAIENMLAQGAYILWNHPGWPDDLCTMYDIHKDLIKQGKIKGVEIGNDVESYPIAYDWIEEYGLHPFANSDIHGYIEDVFASRRPMTLVFAKERSLEGVKEALFAGRTLSLTANNLVGKAEYMAPLVKECLKFDVYKDKDTYCVYKITNNSDIRFLIEIGNTVHMVEAKPGETVKVEIAKGQQITFRNCFLGKGKYYSINQSEL